MLEKLPTNVGRALRRVRPGLGALTFHRRELAGSAASLVVESSAIERGEIARRHTADGAGTSPPLSWSELPLSARSLLLIVEDADSPTPTPLVHAIVWGLSPGLSGLPEGAIATGADLFDDRKLGLSSYLTRGWIPPDPPPGHGPHRYAFQLFALDHDPDLGARAGRRAVLTALREHTIARGLLVGTYAR